MTPKFNAANFCFKDDDQIPDHIEGDPTAEEMDPRKIWLEGSEAVSGNKYLLAIGIDTFSTAATLKAARFRLQEENLVSRMDGVFIGLPG